MRKSIFILIITFFTTQSHAIGDQIDFLGVLIPKHIELKETRDKLKLQGYSVNAAAGEPLYIAAFYTSKFENKTNMLLLGDLQMAMACYFVQDDVMPEYFKKILAEEILLNNPKLDQEKINKDRLIELQNIFQKTLNAGDVVVFEYASDNKLTITINDEIIKSFPNARSIFNALLKTWIGTYPPSRNFKDAILGN